MEELKPCPFCGQKMEKYPDFVIRFKRDRRKRYGIYHEICTIHCNGCGCEIRQAGINREAAEENTRKLWNGERLNKRIISSYAESGEVGEHTD